MNMTAMSSQEIQDYITKQVSINKDIVTYRTLSRVFFINVNVAKNELARFRASVEGESSSATYLLSGALKPPLFYDDEDTMDVDYHGLSYGRVVDTEEDSEEPIRTAMMLVSERDIEDQTSRFTHIH
ncbi:DNA polymerase delta subunit 3, partial [Pleurotus pulmonarius]